MYISKIQLKNVRCIDNLVLDLRSRASTNSSLLLLGNNGVGKSTILKCIAPGLCDQGGASGLLTDMGLSGFPNAILGPFGVFCG